MNRAPPDIEVNIRVLAPKANKTRNEPLGGESGGRGYRENLGVSPIGLYVSGRHLNLIQNFPDLDQIHFTCRGQLQALANSSKQWVFERLFKLRHLLAHRTLGQAELLCRPSRAQVARNCLEALQGRDGGQWAFGHREFQAG